MMYDRPSASTERLIFTRCIVSANLSSSASLVAPSLDPPDLSSVERSRSLLLAIGRMILASTVVGAVAAQQPLPNLQDRIAGDWRAREGARDRCPEGRGARVSVRAAMGVVGAAMGEKWAGAPRPTVTNFEHASL